MSSKKKKTRKICWVEDDDGKYHLDDEFMGNSSNYQDINSSFINDGSDGIRKFRSRINCGVLFAEVMIKPPSDLKLMNYANECIVELHPDTMNLCKLCISGPIILRSGENSVDMNKSVVYRVWPSSLIPLGKIGLSTQQVARVECEVGECLYASGPSQPPVLASHVRLSRVATSPVDRDQTADKFTSSQHFVTYLSNSLHYRYVMSGQIVELSYFGKRFRFRLDEVVTSSSQQPDESSQPASVADGVRQLTTGIGDFSIGDSPRKNARESGVGSPVVYRVSSSTEFSVGDDVVAASASDDADDAGDVGFDGIGGLREQKRALRDLFVQTMTNPESFKRAGVRAVRGVLLHGSPGTGKSMLARAVAVECGARVLHISGSHVVSRYLGESEKQVMEVFARAKRRSPCVVVIDEVDVLCPNRHTSKTDAERRIVSAFIAALDELSKGGWSTNVVVIATTSRVEAVDPALRRSGRLDVELEVPIPTCDERAQILCKLLEPMCSELTEVELREVATRAHGYVGADLAAVCTQAGMHAVRSCHAPTSAEERADAAVVRVKDLRYGLDQIPPSAMRELIVQVPTVRWSDIGGNEQVKKQLRQMVEWPLKHGSALARLGVEAPRGVLMYGPPGCSKTLTAKALATESDLNFISIKGSELFSKYVGESERAVRRVFSKARSAAPSIIFFDELDAIAIERGGGNAVADRVLASLLTEMDGIERRCDVIVVAATNRPEMIDKALLRPGRIDRVLYVPLPDPATRADILRIRFRSMPVGDDVDVAELVARTDSFSGAEMCALCREAGLAALVDDLDAVRVTSRHFERAFAAVGARCTPQSVAKYEEFARRGGNS